MQGKKQSKTRPGSAPLSKEEEESRATTIAAPTITTVTAMLKTDDTSGKSNITLDTTHSGVYIPEKIEFL